MENCHKALAKLHRGVVKMKRDPHLPREEKRLEREKRRLVGLMSNTKWRKVFGWLFERRDLIRRYRIKTLREESPDRLMETPVLCPADLTETRIVDNGPLYPTDYDEIEWVEIVTSNGDELRRGLEAIGQLEIQGTDAGLKIYGYGGMRA